MTNRPNGNGAPPQALPTIDVDALTKTALQHTVQQFPPAINAGAFLVGSFDRGPILPPYGTKERDRMLRVYDQMEYNGLWQGAVAGLIKKIRSTPWEITGDPYWANYYQAVFQNAQFGQGWGVFISLVLRDLLTQDYGAFVELIGPGDPNQIIQGPLGDPYRNPDDPRRYYGIAHKDAWRCYVTGNPTWPVVYYSLMTGSLHRMHHSRIKRFTDMPNPDERYFGIGLCALSRAIGVATREIRMGRYIDSFLDDKPKPGINTYSGITEEQFKNVMATYTRNQSTDGGALFGRTLNLFSMDVGSELKVNSIPFSQTPEKFDYKTYVELDVNSIALALGVDRQEIWELAGKSLGSGQQSAILAQKAEGKFYGDTLQELERFFNNNFLPTGMELRFKPKNTVGDTAQAAIDLQYAQTAQTLAAVPNLTTGNELRGLLASRSETFNKAFTDESGNIELDDSDIKTPQQDVYLTDDAPADDIQNAPIQAAAKPTASDEPTSTGQAPATPVTKEFASDEQRQVFFGALAQGTLGMKTGETLAPTGLIKGDRIRTATGLTGKVMNVKPGSVKLRFDAPAGSISHPTTWGHASIHNAKVIRGTTVHTVKVPGYKELTTKDYQATRMDFVENITDLLNSTDSTSRARFGIVFRAQLRRLGTAAFSDGMKDGGVNEPLDESDLATVQHWVIGQSEYVTQFANDVYQRGLSPAEVRQHAEMWANKALQQMYNEGLMSADRNGVYEWVLGRTEKHCSTCLTLSGQRHRFKQWYTRDLMPQSERLECHGYNCDCRLVKTTEAARGRFL